MDREDVLELIPLLREDLRKLVIPLYEAREWTLINHLLDAVDALYKAEREAPAAGT